MENIDETTIKCILSCCFCRYFLNNILVKQSWIILKRGLGRVLVKYREIKRITVPSNILRDLVRSPYACNHKIY